MQKLISLIIIAILWPIAVFSADRFNIVTFQPAVGDFISVDDAKVYPFKFGGMLDFGVRPLDLRTNGQREREIVDKLLVQHLYGAYPILPYLSVGADFPIAWAYSYTNPDPVVAAGSWNTSLGDINIEAKANIIDNENIGIAIIPFIALPTGNDRNFVGDEGVVGGGKLAITSGEILDRLTVGVNAGGIFREHVIFRNIDVNHQLLLSAAAKLKLTKDFSFITELDTSTPTNNIFKDRNTTPVSARGALSWEKNNLKLLAGAGGGIVYGGGAPVVDGFTMFEFKPSFAKKEKHFRQQRADLKGQETIIQFGFDKADISDTEAHKLSDIADVIICNKTGLNLFITGYADSVGQASYNMILSQNRAEHVARFLKFRGVSSEQMKVDWVGGSGGRENRKVIIKLR